MEEVGYGAMEHRRRRLMSRRRDDRTRRGRSTSSVLLRQTPSPTFLSFPTYLDLSLESKCSYYVLRHPLFKANHPDTALDSCTVACQQATMSEDGLKTYEACFHMASRRNHRRHKCMLGQRWPSRPQGRKQTRSA